VEDYHVLTADECQILAERIKITSLPRECKQYIGKNRGKLDSAPQDPTAIAFEGMSGASSAAAARAKGRHSHAVIQRRYTTNKSKPGESKWFTSLHSEVYTNIIYKQTLRAYW